MTTTIKYRPDIDGLRSIAVLSVIFFHFQIPGFSGGYVGVDVFFVISGFLIGSLILKGLREESFSFTEFYVRRIARLYPAYVTVMVASVLLGALIFLPKELREFGKSLIGSLLYVSNMIFYKDSGYFAEAAVLKPLLHTWSLSTEEQFYILFPVIAYLLYRNARPQVAFYTLVMIAILSLACSMLWLPRNGAAVFYLIQFRAWELFVGVILATGKVSPLAKPSLRNVASLAGLALIVVSVSSYNEQTPFPGAAALAPCIGTGLIIHSGTAGQDALVNRILGMQFPVFIGLISYSLYLWHWPLYVFLRYALGDLGATELAALLCVTFFAALVTWRWIEKPFRLAPNAVIPRPPMLFFSKTVLASAILGAVGFTYWATDGLPARLSKPVLEFAAAATDFRQSWAGCVTARNTRYPGLAFCPIGAGEDNQDLILIWGDSHTRAFKNAIDKIASESGRKGVLIWAGGCPPLFDVAKHETATSGADDLACRTQNEAVRSLLLMEPRIHSVLLIGRWAYYESGAGTGIDRKNRIRLESTGNGIQGESNAEVFERGLQATVTEVARQGRKVYLLQQVPEIPNYKAQRIGALMMWNALSEEELKAIVEVDQQIVFERQGRARSIIEKVRATSGLEVLETSQEFCNNGICSAFLDGKPAYFDNNHITVGASLRVRKTFSVPFQPAHDNAK